MPGLGLETERLGLSLGSKRLGLVNRGVDRGVARSLKLVIRVYFFTYLNTL